MCVFRHLLRIAIDVTVPWSVCLSRSCIVLKRQKITTRFFLRTTAPCFSLIVLKFGLHWPTSSSPDFAPKLPTPVDFI